MRLCFRLILASLVVTPVAVGDTAVLPALIRSPQASPYNVFGGDVALATPTACAVGVRGADGSASNQGAVDCFELKVDGWTFIERLQPIDLAAGDQFGESIAADANWLVVGGTRHDASGVDSGAVWVYRREAGLWRFPQRLIPGMGSDGARFGSAVAVSGGRLAVGAPLGGVAGTVSVYKLVGTDWQLEQTILNPTPAQGDRFGDSIALEGDRLLIGAPFDDEGAIDRGAVHAYSSNGRSWQLQSTLLPMSASDRQYFGRSIAIRNTRAAIGANGADALDGTSASGMVEVYDFVGTSWSRSGELRPETAVAGGHFGWDVAIEAETIVVGEPGYGTATSPALIGRARVFARQPSSQWIPVTSILALQPAANDVFGASVAFASGRLVASAPGRLGQEGAVMSLNLGADCDQNQVSDVLQIAGDPALDCNGDLVLDTCQPDTDADGIPNACECPWDLNGDGFVSSADLSFILTEWGNYGQGPADVNRDLRVDAQDIAVFLSNWGACW
ncbi:MAG: hypothetical protein RIT24_1575 [Planctomycetota bacterium]